jgi:hypothetical protein
MAHHLQPGPWRNTSPAQAPEHHPPPPQTPAPARHVPHPPPQESTVTGRTQNETGSRLGVLGYEGIKLYSYFTASLNYQDNCQQERSS